MRRIPALALSAVLVLVLAVPAAAAPSAHAGSGDPIHPDAIWSEGEAYGTILLGPLPYNGNDQAFDTIYPLFDGDVMVGAVTDVYPGHPDYNGGRWIPNPAHWQVEPYPITSVGDLMAAVTAGDLTLDGPQHAAAFLCPLIPRH